jgi:hypothetical protein
MALCFVASAEKAFYEWPKRSLRMGKFSFPFQTMTALLLKCIGPKAFLRLVEIALADDR